MACYAFVTCFSKEAAASLFGALVAAGHKIGPILTSKGTTSTVMHHADQLGVLLTFEITPKKSTEQRELGARREATCLTELSKVVTDTCKSLNIMTLSIVILDHETGGCIWCIGNAAKAISSPPTETAAVNPKEDKKVMN